MARSNEGLAEACCLVLDYRPDAIRKIPCHLGEMPVTSLEVLTHDRMIGVIFGKLKRHSVIQARVINLFVKEI